MCDNVVVQCTVGGANPFGGVMGNPDMIASMLDNPMVQQMMGNLMQNPQMLQNVRGIASAEGGERGRLVACRNLFPVSTC